MVADYVKQRHAETDYLLLHEIARHAIHVSETLHVALNSVNSIHGQYQDFDFGRSETQGGSLKKHNGFHLSVQMIQSLLARSESNKARLQNETQLVSSFHIL